MALTGETRKAIDKCFASDDVNDILASLQEYEKQGEESELGKWAKKTISTIEERSPTSVKVTLKQMQLGKTWSIAHAFEREYNIAAVFMGHPDFVEGVSARLMRKPPEKPVWQPGSLDEVSWEDVDKFFVLPAGSDRLKLLNTGKGSQYTEYPHGWIGLPTEKDVEAVVKEGGKSKDEVTKHFLQAKKQKLGVKEKVEEILDRKTKTENQGLVWEESPKYRQTRGSQDPNSR